MAASCTSVVGLPSDVDVMCVLSFTAPLVYDQDQFSSQNLLKTTQRPYPAVKHAYIGLFNNLIKIISRDNLVVTGY